MWNMLLNLLGTILEYCYKLTELIGGGVGNYGVALILFTLLTRLLLLPSAIRQQKSMAARQRLQPKIDAINKKYKYDKQKLSEETMKVYKENGVSMFGGCLPMLIQFPILIGLYQVIYRPLTYILKLPQAELGSVAEKIVSNAEFYVQNFPKLSKNIGEFAGKTVEEILKIPQVEITLAKANDLINFNFLGLDLSATPNILFLDWLWLIPILAGAFQYLVAKYSASQTPPPSTDGENPAAGMSSSMMKIFPVMSIVFAFMWPAGMGFYWIISSAFQLIQQIILNKVIKKD